MKLMSGRVIEEGHKIVEDGGGEFDLALIDLKLSDGFWGKNEHYSN